MDARKARFFAKGAHPLCVVGFVESYPLRLAIVLYRHRAKDCHYAIVLDVVIGPKDARVLLVSEVKVLDVPDLVRSTQRRIDVRTIVGNSSTAVVPVVRIVFGLVGDRIQAYLFRQQVVPAF